jgi:hypothetical protein
MAEREFQPELLAEPATMRERFTSKGRIRKAFGGGASFQVSLTNGKVTIWTVGPLGWWHDFQTVPEGTSFDAALALTHIPSFYGWDQEDLTPNV